MTFETRVASSMAGPLKQRPERFSPKQTGLIRLYSQADGPVLLGSVLQLSSTGMTMLCDPSARQLATGARIRALILVGGLRIDCGSAVVVRRLAGSTAQEPELLALGFEQHQPDLISSLQEQLESAPYVTTELLRENAAPRTRTTRASDEYIDKFHDLRSRDLFAKCDRFRDWADDLRDRGLYQRLYRVTVTSGLNNRVTVFDPVQRGERQLICFDSNSYLCLHEHPRVVARVEDVLRRVGYGSPSAQLLGGTNRYLRELELELSTFHGREDTVVFPTGYAANAGIISALVRRDDALLRDRLAHASLHDACRASSARFNRVFGHNDVHSLERFLRKADEAGCDGKLIVTDGVFSMHGRVAPLPELVALARRYDAKLMIDDAHALGVLGATGGGIEEHFNMPGSVDVMMGTLSKTIGALGGYVSGSRNLVTYLRFFSPSSMFTTSTPAAWCAGMVEALRVIRDEPEHHQALWRNIRSFVPALRAAGFIVPDPHSPIVTIFMGEGSMMWEFSRELFDRGIKCSSVMYPAVPKSEAILRLVLTSKHTAEDLDLTLDALVALGTKYGILHKPQEEIVAIGKRLTAMLHVAPVERAVVPD